MPGEDLSILLYSHVPIQREHVWRFLYKWVLLLFWNRLGLVPSGGPLPGEHTHTGEPEGVPEPQENPLVQEPRGTNQGMGDGREDGCKTNENNRGSNNLIHNLLSISV